jgi:hypothetical protein
MTLSRINLVGIAALVGLFPNVKAQTIDPPEKVRDRFRLDDSISVVVSSIRYKSFLYVFDRENRRWKSPQMASYFCMLKDSLHQDLDRNGRADFLLSYTQCGLPCASGLFVSLNGGKENFVIHLTPAYPRDSATRKNTAGIRLESSSKMPAQLWDAVQDDLQKLACDDVSRQLIQKTIAHGIYNAMPPDSTALPELRRAHAEAMKLYRRGYVGRGADTLDRFFDLHDYRQINAKGNDSMYTAILNDFGLLLLKSRKGFDWTKEILTYVLARNPAPASAYLNLGDLLYGYASTRQDGKDCYKRYLDLMTEKGMLHKVPPRVLERIKL